MHIFGSWGLKKFKDIFSPWSLYKSVVLLRSGVEGMLIPGGGPLSGGCFSVTGCSGLCCSWQCACLLPQLNCSLLLSFGVGTVPAFCYLALEGCVVLGTVPAFVTVLSLIPISLSITKWSADCLHVSWHQCWSCLQINVGVSIYIMYHLILMELLLLITINTFLMCRVPLWYMCEADSTILSVLYVHFPFLFCAQDDLFPQIWADFSLTPRVIFPLSPGVMLSLSSWVIFAFIPTLVFFLRPTVIFPCNVSMIVCSLRSCLCWSVSSNQGWSFLTNLAWSLSSYLRWSLSLKSQT